MSYVGNTNTTQGFIPAIDYFSGNGSTVAFTLSRPVASVAQVQATISNVPQNPSSAFSVSNNTITFTSAPPSGTNNIYVYYTSPITQVIAPSQGTVSPTSLSTGGPYWDTSGNVGIGTSSPSVKLDVVGSTTSGLRLRSSSGATNGFNIYNNSGTDTAYLMNFYGGPLVFGTSNTERMRIDSSGNVGIGTSSPNILSLNRALTLNSTSNQQGIEFAVNGTVKGLIQSNGDTEFIVGAFAAIPLTLRTGNTERARIDTSGNLLVGTTSAALTGSQVGTASKFAVSGSAGRVQIADTGNDIAFSRNASNYISATAGTSASISVKAGSASGGVVLTNGATSWVSASDERTKTDLVEITDAAAKVATLRAVTGRYKTDKEGVSRAFLIAQDVQAVLPEAVTVIQNADNDEDNGKLMLSYTETIPLLVAAIKEQQAIIQTLTDRITLLENK